MVEAKGARNRVDMQGARSCGALSAIFRVLAITACEMRSHWRKGNRESLQDVEQRNNVMKSVKEWL